jgi:hypothetical protein
LHRLLLSVVLYLTALGRLAKLLGSFGSCRWSLLRAGEPLYCSCHIGLEVKDPVKAAQLEGLTDLGLKGRQGNISTVATGKLVVVDQRCQARAVHKTYLAQVNNQLPGSFSEEMVQFLSQLGAIPCIHVSRDHYYCNSMVLPNTQFHLSSSRFHLTNLLKNLEDILPFTIIYRDRAWAYLGPVRKADF